MTKPPFGTYYPVGGFYPIIVPDEILISSARSFCVIVEFSGFGSRLSAVMSPPFETKSR